jgi:hypothetical protein
MPKQLDTASQFRKAVSKKKQPVGLDVPAAIIELQQKTKAQIEFESSLRWGSLAVAAYTLSERTADKAERISRFSEGEDYNTEAREHAAQVGDEGRLLEYLNKNIDGAREKAFAEIVKFS